MTDFEKLKRYVRMTATRGRFVEFEFSIGDPAMYIEMILPHPAFRDFCEKNNVTMMTEDEGRAADKDREKWRYCER